MYLTHVQQVDVENVDILNFLHFMMPMDVGADVGTGKGAAVGMGCGCGNGSGRGGWMDWNITTA